MTPDFWTGVLTGFIAAFIVSFFAGVALVHLCGLRETGDDRPHGATINGHETCPGCGVALTDGVFVLAPLPVPGDRAEPNRHHPPRRTSPGHHSDARTRARSMNT